MSKTAYSTSIELYHHGVKGQKWGIRRYQNYDGSYTQKGLERYKKSLSGYEAASSNYENARKSGSKAEQKRAEAERNRAKKALKVNYRQLKDDYAADKGKELYKKGTTITSINQKKIATILTHFAASAVTDIATNNISAEIHTKNMGDISVRDLIRLGVNTAILGNAVRTTAKHISDTNNLRAYYAHSRKKNPYED